LLEPEHIVVMGAMGSGKTTLGRRLADALGREFHDSDRSIERRIGKSGREIAETEGVEALHRLEKDVFLEALADRGPAVIAAAASVIEDTEVRRGMAGAFCIWVTADPRILADRAARGDHRRSVAISEHLESRDRLFGEMADLVIDTGDRSASETAALVLEELRAAEK
jgi:shikimate kinase